VDVRIIAATNRDLSEQCREGTFREDLMYRLDVVRLELPSLRERPEDIPLLVHHFLERFTRDMGKKPIGVTDAAMRAMLSHEWRGNVRELENVIERAVIFAEDRRIDVGDLPFGPAATAGGFDGDAPCEQLREAMSRFERQHIIQMLRRHRYDKAETAEHLGISVSSLYRKLDELDIPKNLEAEDQHAGLAT
jgi:DNA-binding NtrC family response regulator